MSRYLILLALATASAQDVTLSYKGEKVEIFRDRYGIPLIKAQTGKGAYFGQGYCHITDRLHQMENWRLYALGRTSEKNSDGLERDYSTRINGYTDKEYDEFLADLPKPIQEFLLAYIDGINEALKAKPEITKWTYKDSAAIMIFMLRRFGSGGAHELQVQKFVEAAMPVLGAAKLGKIMNDLLPDNDTLAPTSLGNEDTVPEKTPPEKKGGSFILPENNNTTDVCLFRLSFTDDIARQFGVPAYAGSNSWCVSPKKSTNGCAMLYGGPMMGQSNPQICCEAALECGAFRVYGMSFAGIPGILIGHNDYCAWSTTSGGADLQDIYCLELNPENKNQYKYKGEWKYLEVRDEVFKLADGSTQTKQVFRSLYGPVLEFDGKKKAYTVRSSFWKREYRAAIAFLGFDRAKSLTEFESAAKEITTSHNFLYADVDGNIAYWYLGLHPKRVAKHNTRLVQKGDGSMDWEGFYPFEQIPQSKNSPRGFYDNWNNKPDKNWASLFYRKMYWGKKITDTLASSDKLTFEEFTGIAKKTAYHEFEADYFKEHFLAAADKHKKELTDDEDLWLGKIKAWDNMKVEGDVLPVLFMSWIENAAMEFVRPTLNPELIPGGYRKNLAIILLYGIECPERLNYDYRGDRDIDKIIFEAFRKALKEKNGSKWEDETIDFGKAGRFKSQRGRGTYMMAAILDKKGVRSESAWAPGISEDEKDKHFNDLVPIYRDWKFKPIWSKD